MWQILGRGLVVFAGLVLAGSFGGELHGLGDSLAVFRPLILVGSLAVTAFVWRWRIAQGLALASALIAGWHGLAAWPDREPLQQADIIVYQKNMLFRPADRAPLMADIIASGADIVTLQEVSRANQPMLEALLPQYPHQALCAANAVGAVAILSRTPLRDIDCGRLSGFARAVTQIDGRDVQVVSVHLHWPWPYRQRPHAVHLIGYLEPLDTGPTIVGGDFNMVASGRSIAWFEQATGTGRVGPLIRTFSLFGYPLGIDHVLATGGTGTAFVRPQLGSDHYGVLAQIAFP